MSKLAERMIVRALLAATATLLMFAGEMVRFMDERPVMMCVNMTQAECDAPVHPSERQRPPLPASTEQQ